MLPGVLPLEPPELLRQPLGLTGQVPAVAAVLLAQLFPLGRQVVPAGRGLRQVFPRGLQLGVERRDLLLVLLEIRKWD